MTDFNFSDREPGIVRVRIVPPMNEYISVSTFKGSEIFNTLFFGRCIVRLQTELKRQRDRETEREREKKERKRVNNKFDILNKDRNSEREREKRSPYFYNVRGFIFVVSDSTSMFQYNVREMFLITF
jgi:hypothetical protein